MILPRRWKWTALVCFVLTTFIQSTHSRYHDNRPKRHNGAHMYLPASSIIPGGEGSSDGWSSWSSPSSCSRTCGGGVAYVTRECLINDYYGRPKCQGGTRKYFSCNTQDCPDNEPDFRSQQCASFNSVPFENIKYNWVPYTRGANPCELNCMPPGERFYYRHRTKVIDGTRCNDESYDVCVDGVCQPVGCDRMLGSSAKEDKCRKCAGDGSSCRTVSGLLSKDFQQGYNDILLIPANATNIDIREIAPSSNYLACRNLSGHFYLNGNWRIDFPRPLHFAGSLWNYNRKQDGFFASDHISNLGPTSEPIYLVLLYQDKNVGIKYEYSLPVSTALSTEPERYNWTFTPYSQCSVTCGGGIKTRNVTCNKVQDLEQVEDSLCDASEKPADVKTCGHEPCPPKWAESEWSNCTEPCGEGGTQERIVQCKRVAPNGVEMVVPDVVCSEEVGPKPPHVQECNLNTTCPKWHVGKWKACDKLCGEGLQKRQVVCYTDEEGKKEIVPDSNCPKEKPESEKSCNLRPCEGVDWIVTLWSGCEACGLTQETRTATCATKDGNVQNETYCLREKPVLARPCESKKCKYQWFTSEWSECSVKCGKGVQTRIVLCGQLEGDSVKNVTDFSKCESSEKPEDVQECEVEKDKCPGQWFVSPWSACSRKCGGGSQVRKVFCMANGEKTKDENCDEKEFALTEQPCNTDPCTDDELLPVGTTGKPIENDEDDECTDDDYDDDLSESAKNDEMLDDHPPINFSGEDETEPSLIADNLMGLTEGEDPDEGDGNVDNTLSQDDGSGSGSSDLRSIFAESTISTFNPSDSSTSTTNTDDSETTTVGLDTSTSVDSTNVTVSPLTESTDFANKTDTTLTDDTSTTDTVTRVSLPTDYTDATASTSSDESATGNSTLDTDVTDVTPTTSFSETSATENSTLTTGSLLTEGKGTTTSEDVTDSDMTEETSATKTAVSGETPSTDVSVSTETYATETTLTGETDATSVAEDVYTASTVTDQTGQTSSTEETAGTDSIVSTETTKEISSFSATTETSETSEGEIDSTGESLTISTDTTLYASTISTETEPTLSTVEQDTTVSTTPSDASTQSSVESSTFSTDSDTSTVSVDLWSTDEQTPGTTPRSPFEKDGKKSRQCKPRKRKPACLKSTFGCCPDNITAASGPFSEGCKVIKTCKDTKYGCCHDNVSPAQGPEYKGCPEPECVSTLFGCCWDEITAAEGDDGEGCPEIPTTLSTTEETTVTTEDDTTTTDISSTTMTTEESSVSSESTTVTEESTVTDESTLFTGSTEAVSEVPCEKSEFGCCQNSKTAASGLNYAGCEEENCFNSLYGCCSDNKTFASGPNEEGCPLCLRTEFGCCPDDSTPAHGHLNEGCCLTAPYGCCPDNINPANGPEFDGCSCELSPYGCCSDGKTSAQGPNHEGCRCEETEFGCCPDRNTVAKGPKYEGCPCHTFQFGCCPDGVTVAKDISGQTCNCLYSEFKCCSDGVSPAKGPNYEGCNCATSKFGCCPDGVTDAKGDNFEGCANVIEPVQKACGLAQAPGSCRNFTIRHFYDKNYGGCSRFWYGGCEGNGNRFDSLEECQAQCVNVPGKNACFLPLSKGPCDGSVSRYYYDFERRVCEPFEYGGCQGNTNNFLTLEDCRSTCLEDEILPPCEQTVEAGPCDGKFERWYHDNETQICKPFTYGGCKGNKNNYPTEQACNYHCKMPGVHKAHCKLPEEAGNCNDRIARWYYSESNQKCMPFYYSGCGGNKNNFNSLKECETQCPRPIAKDVCELPAVMGDCANWTSRWYYDTTEEYCKHFYYGQCGGNGNNFETEEACMQRCKKQLRPEPEPEQEPKSPRPDPVPSEPHPAVFDTQTCFLHPDPGRCDRYSVKWYYNSDLGLCDEFQYGGCEGNANRFETEEECENSCVHVRQTCTLPQAYGRCSENLTRWYYDERAQDCFEFQFSGCRGNKNNFLTKRKCLEFCGDDEEVPDPSLDPRFDSTGKSVCDEVSDPGTCADWVPAYYFNKTHQRCEMFYYGGCGGNRNRFSTEEECNANCVEPQSVDVCQQPAEQGRCSDWRTVWFYDNKANECKTFSYGGCEGNGNRFVLREECEAKCKRQQESKPDEGIEQPKPAVTVAPERDVCEYYRHECDQIRCPYGVRRSYGADSCEVCTCVDPCAEHSCPPDTQCSVDISRTSEYVAICRLTNKPGDCPALANDTSRCERECDNDAHCREEMKCCVAGCSYVCVPPAERRTTTTSAPHSYPAGLQPVPAQLAPKEQKELDVNTPAGGLAVLRCFATGYPPPTVVWMRGTVIIDTNQGRYVLSSNGDLNIIQVVRSDSGSYVCVANNGLGNPVTREITLDVTDPRPTGVYIVAPLNSTKIVTLDAPVILRCPAGGYPKPQISWWKGKKYLPLKTAELELMRDFSLLIHRVQLSDLGEYTCEGYAGSGRPKAIYITLKAYRPPYITNQDYEKYANFLVDSPHAEVTPKPAPTTPHVPATQAPITHLVEPSSQRVSAVLRLPGGGVYEVGKDIVMECDVQGYPVPNVIWRWNGIELVPSERVAISTNPHRLIVYQARAGDAGRYVCNAFNEYSSSSHEESVEITVNPDCKDNPYFANCALIVKGEYCHNQYYAKFCCRSCTLAGQLSGVHPNAV